MYCGNLSRQRKKAQTINGDGYYYTYEFYPKGKNKYIVRKSQKYNVGYTYYGSGDVITCNSLQELFDKLF